MVKNLHEGAMGEILNAIDADTKAAAKDANKTKMSSLNVSSISKASKDLIMSFPVLCDNSLDPRTAAMICKAIERKCVSMLQMIFSSCSFEGSNGREAIAQWHNNINMNSLGLDDYISLCDKVASSIGESANSDAKDKQMINEAVSIMKQQLKAPQKSYPVSSISEHAVNDYKVSVRYGKTVVTEATAADVRDAKVKLAQSEANKYNKEAAKYAAEARAADAKANRDAANADNSARKLSLDIDKTQSEVFKAQLLDSDVKKCNELVPSLMIVKFNTPVGGNNGYVSNEFVAGVKARLIAVDSYEIYNKIKDKGDKNGLLKFIKAKTGEISFVKDYLLGINKAKIDAKNNSVRNKNRESRIWRTLEKRSTKSVWQRLWGAKNNAGAITTLVVSAEIANLLKKEDGIDIANIKTASNVMDAYNLLCLVIVDESTEVARFLFDGDDSFEDLSFNSLERESGDGSYKKVINLLSKMNK